MFFHPFVRSVARSLVKPAFTCIIGQTSFLRRNSIFTQPRRSYDSIFPQFLRHRWWGHGWGISIKLLVRLCFSFCHVSSREGREKKNNSFNPGTRSSNADRWRSSRRLPLMAASFRRALARLPMINQPRQPHFYSASTRRRLPLSETPFPLFVPFFTVSLSPPPLLCFLFKLLHPATIRLERGKTITGGWLLSDDCQRRTRGIRFPFFDSLFPFNANRSRNFHFLRTYYTLPTNLLSSRTQTPRALPSSNR